MLMIVATVVIVSVQGGELILAEVAAVGVEPTWPAL